MSLRLNVLALLSAAVAFSTATAQAAEQVKVQSEQEALAQDANEYAVNYGVPPELALSRLRAQLESAASTDAIRQEFAGRLTGIAIEHRPEFRIVVLLTGSEPVSPRIIRAGGLQVPVAFRSGLRANREQAVQAMVQYQSQLRTSLPNARGMGHDQKTGELVLLVTKGDAERHGLSFLKQQAQTISGMPVRVELAERQTNHQLAGGGKVEGVEPADGKRYACTTGFIVTDGTRDGIVTAAHCPNDLEYRDADGTRIPLSFDRQWGWRHQDVQLHVAAGELRPLFYSDRRSGTLRELASWRNRRSIRAGEWLCHYGESSGYSCAEVELTDYAPPADLCGGPCGPMWVTVSGPKCRSGDSGGPIFLGSVAFGITKGGSGSAATRCNFYYFMSTDFLPEGWGLLHRGQRNGAGATSPGPAR
jgi:streptogrisin C